MEHPRVLPPPPSHHFPFSLPTNATFSTAIQTALDVPPFPPLSARLPKFGHHSAHPPTTTHCRVPQVRIHNETKNVMGNFTVAVPYTDL